jgi:hypothetical protein
MFAFKPDWRHVLRHAWSVRLMILAALLSGCEVSFSVMTAFEIVPPFIPAGLFAALAGAVTIAAFVARVLAQKEFPQ